MAAPREVQKQVASELYNQRGIQPWAQFNPAIARAVGWQGQSARGERPADIVLPSGGGGGGGGGGELQALQALMQLTKSPGDTADEGGSDSLSALAQQLTGGGSGGPDTVIPRPGGGGDALPVQQVDMRLAPYAIGNARPGQPSSIEGVSPRLSSKIEAAVAAMPPDVLEQFLIISGYRDAAQQHKVNPGVTYSQHGSGTGPPGTGSAVDIVPSPRVLNWFREHPEYGIGQPLSYMGPKERGHTEEIDPQTGGRLPIMQAQYNPLSGATGAGGATAAAPAIPGMPGVIPGTNATPEQLAALNALFKMGGINNPFESLLETYYKSPGYLGGVKAAESTAEFGVKKQFEPGLQADILRATTGPKVELKEKEAIIDRRSEEIKQNRDLYNNLQRDFAKDNLTMETSPDGKLKLVPLPAAAEQRAQNAQDIAAATKRGEAPYTFVDATVKLPGESQEREMKLSAEDYNKIKAGQEVTVNGVKIPAMSGITLGKQIYSPEQTAAIQARGTAQAEMYKSGQKALDTAHEAVRGANQRAPYYGSILTAMEGFKPGATAEARLTGMQYLKDLGIIKGDNVPQGEAMRLAAERLAFLALPPGQGSWAIAERQMLKNSIGSMALSPEGMTDAVRMMQQLDDYDRKVSEIHRQVADDNKGLPNLLEAQRRVEKLGPPLTTAQQTALERLQQQPATPPAAPGGGGNATKSANEIIQNGWRYDATTHRPIGPVQ
jgi:hypothetical protein